MKLLPETNSIEDWGEDEPTSLTWKIVSVAICLASALTTIALLVALVKIFS